MPFFKKSLAGPGYIILNIIRVMNIIALLAVVAASSIMLVKTFIVSKFFFFDGVSHVITAVLGICLIITELPLFRRYIANNWPLLSPSSGFVTFGILMIVLGVSILGNLNKEATSQDSLGTAFWRIVIASGIVVSILGVVNIFASYTFRNKTLPITARQVRSHGSLASQKVYISPSPSSHPSTRKRSFHLNRADTLPSYHTNAQTARFPPPQQQPIRNISAPVGMTSPPAANTAPPAGYNVPGQFEKPAADANVPVINGVQRPDLAFHPALQGGRF